jgi:hypothetical protein
MYERVDYAWHSRKFEPSWSFQQMRDLGYADSGIPPQEHELEPTRTGSSSTSQSNETAISDTTTGSSQDDKILSQLGNVDFSY